MDAAVAWAFCRQWCICIFFFFSRLYSLGEMAFSELTSRAEHLYDEWIKDAGELSHSSCHLLDFDFALQSSNGTSPPLRPQGGRLVSHVLPAATNRHPAVLHLLCHVTGAQVDGKPQALQPEADPHCLQLQLSGVVPLHVLWGMWTRQLCSRPVKDVWAPEVFYVGHYVPSQVCFTSRPVSTFCVLQPEKHAWPVLRMALLVLTVVVCVCKYHSFACCETYTWVVVTTELFTRGSFVWPFDIWLCLLNTQRILSYLPKVRQRQRDKKLSSTKVA